MLETIRASAVLTTGYVAATVLGPSTSAMNPALHNQLNVLLKWTKGSLTSLSIKIEFSHDGTTYYQETFESIVTGTSTLSLGEYTMTTEGNYHISIPIKYNYIKVSAKGVGTVTDSLLQIDAVIGTV